MKRKHVAITGALCACMALAGCTAYQNLRYNLVTSAGRGGTTTSAASSEKTGASTASQKAEDVGVLIDGVRWATCNVGEVGKFASKPQDSGNYYTFAEAQDACPDGWRIPTRAEFESLEQADNGWKTVSKVVGRQFGSGRNTLFFPAAGYRETDGSPKEGVNSGCYWSSTAPDDTNGYNLTFTDKIVYSGDKNDRTLGFSVRCVQE